MRCVVRYFCDQKKHLTFLTMVLGLVGFPGALAAESASPSTEVKFFLKPRHVLDTNYRPNDALRTAFKVSKEKKKKPVLIRMQFLDGPRRELHQQQWNIRFREIQDQDHIEMTFKRRYPVDDSVDATLATASQDGFNAASANEYESELEWGYHKQTLTFAQEKRARDAEERSPTLPSPEDSRHLAEDKMPDKLEHWKEEGWVRRVLADACLYGPVDGKRWHGSHAEIDDKIVIEVWALPTADRISTEHIVEISFKKKKYDTQATVKRQKLLQFLKKKGWLLEEDVLKTTLIFERSRPNC
jgi:hypothetical protein